MLPQPAGIDRPSGFKIKLRIGDRFREDCLVEIIFPCGFQLKNLFLIRIGRKGQPLDVT